jgi:hypothetical protein
MDISRLVSSVLVVEFGLLYLINVLKLGKTSQTWYKKFGAFAVLSDVTSILIGVLLAHFIFPNAHGYELALASVAVQITHDVLFYLLFITQIPRGTNTVIDIMKDYSGEAGWTIIAGDAMVMCSTVLIYHLLGKQSFEKIAFVGFLSLYAITYVVY